MAQELYTGSQSHHHKENDSVFTNNGNTNENSLKRKRLSTGDGDSNSHQNSSVAKFKNLSVDDKLVEIFTGFGNLGQKIDTCLTVIPKVTKLEDSIDAHENRLLFLEYKSLDLEARSRRNNLIFHGLPENREENCSHAISDIISSLGISPCPAMPRVHRLGPYKRNNHRPIIANFLDSRDVDLITSKAYKLKGSNVSINRDFPKEIMAARKSLWPKVKSLKSEFPSSKVNLVYPAKIVKDGKVIADSFPNWNSVLSGNRASGYNNVAQSSAQQHRVSDSANSQRKEDPNPQQRNRQPRRTSRSPKSRGHARSHAPSRPSSVEASQRNRASSADSQFSRPWNQHSSQIRVESGRD